MSTRRQIRVNGVRRRIVGVLLLPACSAVSMMVNAPSLAQPVAKTPKVGVLAERAAGDPALRHFVEGLRELGYVEGQNVVIEWRYAGGAVDRYQALAAELVSRDVDVIVVGGLQGARAARAVSAKIPIVFTSVSDPVGTGLVANLARPDGNATGLSNVTAELSAKQLELLKLAAPAIARVAVLHDPAISAPSLARVRAAAAGLGLELLPIEVRRADDVPAAFASASARRAEAVLAISSPVLGNALPELAKLAVERRLPSIYARREFAELGGLLAYGPSFAANYRRAATYVDKILRGATPASLPVEQPTTFELVVNLGTARALGLTLPASLLARVDQRIE